MSRAAIVETVRARLLAAATDSEAPTAIRLAALLWRDCPVEAVERALRSETTIERLAATRHPRMPEKAMPMLVRTGAEEDRVFWIGVVVHVTTDAENIGQRNWKDLSDVASVLAELARVDALVDTPTHSIGRDLIDATSVELPRERIAQLSHHPLPLVTALLLARRDLFDAAEVAMTLGEPHPVIAEKLALRTRSPFVLAALGQKYLEKVDRRDAGDWRAVEHELAASPHTPPEVLAGVMALPQFGSWLQLAENPAIPAATQRLLLERGRTRRRPFRLRDFDLEALGRNACATAETIEALAGHEVAPVRAAVGARPDVSGEIVARLARDGDPKVRAVIARRPDLPADLAAALADDVDPSVVCVLASSARAPEDRRLGWEARASTDTRMRDALAMNPATTAALLAEWLEVTDPTRGEAPPPALRGLRVALAANPRTPPGRLAAIASPTGDPDEAASAVRNPSCPIDVLEAIATATSTPDTVWLQSCLFANPMCSTSLLERALGGLAGDLFNAVWYRAARNALHVRTRP